MRFTYCPLDIWYRQRKGNMGALKRVEFFWIVRDAPSFGWFQSLLSEVEAAQTDRQCYIVLGYLTYDFNLCPSANFLRINIYLTAKVDEGTLWNIAVNDAGAAYDPLTLLRTRTMFGRPDWKSIYSNLRMAIESGRYLPGREASLKTGVRVSLISSPCFFSLTVRASKFSDTDLLLWGQLLCYTFVICLI